MPNTSLNAHLVVKACQNCAGPAVGVAAALAVRKAFFSEARDVSSVPELLDIVGAMDEAVPDSDKLHAEIVSGRAGASLMSDYQNAEALKVRGSPTFVLDSGRQMLFGNVGYRVLHANVEELLSHPSGEASWC